VSAALNSEYRFVTIGCLQVQISTFNFRFWY